MPTATPIYVFHAGALGDFVLIWPLLRALAQTGAAIHVVADSEKAALAAASIEPHGCIVPVNPNHRPFSRLWTGEPAAPPDVRHDVATVINMVASPSDSSALSTPWERAARTMFPNARFHSPGEPGSATRAALWRAFSADRIILPRRENPRGPVVCHVGAGANAKRWPLHRWQELGEILEARSSPVSFIAGEVEADRFTPHERALFESLRGCVVPSLTELANIIGAARLFIGADTGPTHLAAQLGIRTLALFGPTDPSIWSPIGPAVTVLSPSLQRDMAWLDVSRVAAHIFNEKPRGA